ncbi:MAG TPA: universal stress protein [Anaeromyxobacter sp.]|nr:universal stress protein [Anaeromyxobacter sp.]
MKAFTWKKICCPLDAEPSSRAGLAVAVDLCRRLGAELTLLHVSDPARPDATHAGAFRAEAEQAGVRTTAAEIAGAPAAAIAEYANRHAFDLVIMGTHARTGREHMLTGSVAESTVRLARCPVMVVHE